MKHCERLIERYIAWLGANSQAIPESNTSCCVVTPFLTPEHDPLVAYLQKLPDGTFKISDRGFVSSFLFMTGIELSTPQRIEKFKDVMGNKDLRWEQDELLLTCQEDSLEQSLHRFIGAMLTLMDFYLMAYEEEAAVPFTDEVRHYLDDNHQSYIPSYKIKGKTIQHTIEFVLNGRGKRYAEALAAATPYNAKVRAERLAFKFSDIRPVRKGFIGIAIYDDRKDVWTPDTLTIITTYSDSVIPWTKKGQLLSAQ